MLTKALSVKQPWASYLVCGLETIECRSWPTKYRGELLICSSKGDFLLEVDPPANEIILPGGLALGDLFDCKRMTKNDFDAALVLEDREWEANVLKGYAWHIKPLFEIIPVPIKGKLGIYRINIQYEKLPKRFVDHAAYYDWITYDKIFRDPKWENEE